MLANIATMHRGNAQHSIENRAHFFANAKNAPLFASRQKEGSDLRAVLSERM
jgi:hypothetical protein